MTTKTERIEATIQHLRGGRQAIRDLRSAFTNNGEYVDFLRALTAAANVELATSEAKQSAIENILLQLGAHGLCVEDLRK
ncbi:hypothetical protein ACRTDM_16955 [Shewanella algae]|uniref:hypothetical protein n=1 Tax=Shewanella algae TaxID=38313 RepID=UPI003D7E4AE9